MKTTLLNSLTCKVTAFGGWVELTRECRQGYVPTLRKGCPEQSAVGQALEAAGHRVFWIR